jgi:translation elongation factor EF-4
VKKYPDNYVFNLHLDQKKASYAGHNAHSGEYEGEVVNDALEKIKRALEAKIANTEIKEPENKDVLNAIGEGDLNRDQKILEGTKKESKLKKLFKKIF